MRKTIRQLFEKLTGYWIYKSASLPAGVSLKHALSRFEHGSLRTIFDVGANIGESAIAYKEDFRDASIYCFEPVNSTFMKLQSNLKGIGNIITENLALGEAAGQKEIRLFSDWHGGNSLNEQSMNSDEKALRQTVNISTIDDYCEKKNVTAIDLLKIDTEGYELNVLKGAGRMLKNKKISFIICEAGFFSKNPRNTYLPELTEYLAQLGYFIFALYNGGTEDWDKGMCYGNILFVNKEFALK